MMHLRPLGHLSLRWDPQVIRPWGFDRRARRNAHRDAADGQSGNPRIGLESTSTERLRPALHHKRRPEWWKIRPKSALYVQSRDIENLRPHQIIVLWAYI